MVTVKDVARRAGVPVRMAERALAGITQGKRRDARERAERVFKAAEELGYHPSEVARALKRGATRTIGLLVPNLTDMFYAAASEIAMDEAAKHGYSVIIRLTRFQAEATREGVMRLRSAGVDGILFGDDDTNLDPELAGLLVGQKYPLVTFGHPGTHHFPSVSPEHSAPMRSAVRLLTENGHARVTLALFKKENAGSRMDAECFRKACSDLGVRGEIVFRESMEQYADLAKQHRDALLINDKYAMRAFLDAAAGDARYHPDLIGFYNEWTWAQASAGKLQGVIMENAEQLVRTAVQTIVEQMTNPGSNTVKIPAVFYSKRQFPEIHIVDLANQYLGIYSQINRR